jgi:hypothetical protein
MATSVSICSKALLMLGDKPIASFTEGTKGATLASNLYPDERRAFLRAHPWNVAIARVQLAPLADAPAFGWRAAFLLPNDCLRVLDVQFGSASIEHKIEGRKVMADASGINLTYIADLDEDQWDAAMVKAMTTRMAALMAYAITASASLADAMDQASVRAIKQAKNLDGQEGTPDSIDDDPLMQSRYSGGGF